MLHAILWVLLGMFIGSAVTMIALSLLAVQRAGRIAQLERANARLLGDVATACEQNVELRRDLAKAEGDRDGWRTTAVS